MNKSFNLRLMSGAAIALFAAPGSQALAQAGGGEDVVVTGTRIVRNGYSAPTPVTVVATEDLAKVAPNSIPEGLNQLPQFNGSNGVAATRDTGTATKPGVGNYLSLRNLGAIRTLVLVDGQRLPPTTYDGTVDANIIPSALVQRVDVVTGGASAAYGSDAVSGVINFILDTKFNGLKGSVQGGISRYDDGKSFKYSLAGGRDIAGGRGHLLFSYDKYRVEGVKDPLDRPGGSDYWVRVGATPLSSAAAGTAANPFVMRKQGRFNTGAPGTLFQGFPTTTVLGQGSINVGNPYRGYVFLPGGVIKPFDVGQVTGTPTISLGGDGAFTTGRTLTATQDTNNYFGRVDFDVTENVQAFAQLSYADNFNSFVSIGSGTQQGDFKIAAENAFLPAQVSADLIACGAPCAFTVSSRIQQDQPYKKALMDNYATTFTSGLKGKIGAYDWRLGYSHGDTLLKAQHYGNFENQHWYYALDAVRDTAAYRTSLGAALAPGLAAPQGNIVCRATLTNPTQAAGCVPINIFGKGSPSQAAWDYVSKVSTWQVSDQMDIFNGSMSGDLFTLPAGPVSFAVGGEYRKQELHLTSNNDPNVNVLDPSISPGVRTAVGTSALKYNSTNVGRANGQQDIKEAFTEFAVPILKDSAIGDFDINAAGRYTDYETSGIARTWKVGLSYSPLDQLRFRATKSKDIRAPNLFELFAGKTATRGNVTDPHVNNLAGNAVTYTQGNPLLEPEEGDTKTIGVVWRPDFISGLSMSVDYYNIDIAQAIGTATNTNILQDCENSGGTGIACTFIERPLPFSDRSNANYVISVASLPFNQAAQKMEGFDYEVNYRVPFVDKGMLGPATLDLHLIGSFLGNYQIQARAGERIVQSNQSVSGQGTNIGGVNSQNNIQNRINLQANYTDGPLSLNAQVRYLGGAKWTQDPLVFYVDNSVPAIAYVDATISYEKEISGKMIEAFLTVNNIFEPTPPIFGVGQPGQGSQTNANIYDVMGRYYTTGLRFKF